MWYANYEILRIFVYDKITFILKQWVLKRGHVLMKNLNYFSYLLTSGPGFGSSTVLQGWPRNSWLHPLRDGIAMPSWRRDCTTVWAFGVASNRGGKP